MSTWGPTQFDGKIDTGIRNEDPLHIKHGNTANTTAMIINGRQVGGRSDIVFRDDQGRDIAKVSSHNNTDPNSDQNHGFQVYVKKADGATWYSPFLVLTLKDQGQVNIVGQFLNNDARANPILDTDPSTGRVAIGRLANTATAKLDIDADKIRLRKTKTPLSSIDAGEQGDIAWDANYMYVCVATNTWKRSPLTSW